MLSDFDLYVYKFLTNNISQISIVEKLYERDHGGKILGVSKKKRILHNLRSKVNYSTKKLEKEGYIEPVSGEANPKVYRSTTRTPVVSESDTPVVSDKECMEQSLPHETKVENNIQIESICYKFAVIGKPRRKIHWDHVAKWVFIVQNNY